MIPNFKEIVSPFATNLWRGGEPETAQDWKDLADRGVTRVIKLNEPEKGDGGPDNIPDGLNFEVTAFPIDEWQQLIMEPTQQAISDAVYLLSQGDAFIHCHNGWDRTGLGVGVYRVRKDKWDKELAYQEMLNNGFHPILVGLQLFWDLHV